jgi:hypothetical protein
MPQPPDDRIQIRRQPGFARQRLLGFFLIHPAYMAWRSAKARGK